MIKVQYIKNLKQWQATYVDELGQLGLAMLSKSREQAVFSLGMCMGREPQEFSRPIGEYLN